jgi:hypothetical protein
MAPKNNSLRDKLTGNLNANRPLSEAGREGAEVRRPVRYDAYKHAYNAAIRMYPELAKTPTVTANVAAAAVRAADAAPTAPQYPMTESTSVAKAQDTGETYTADKFSEPETSPADWVDQLARDAADLLQQKSGASND